MCFISTLADVSVLAERTVIIVNQAGVDIEVYLVAYADDISTLIDGNTEYFSSAGLSINPDKSEVINF